MWERYVAPPRLPRQDRFQKTFAHFGENHLRRRELRLRLAAAAFCLANGARRGGCKTCGRVPFRRVAAGGSVPVGLEVIDGRGASAGSGGGGDGHWRGRRRSRAR